MAVVDTEGNSGRVILVRNHEGGGGSPYLNQASITYANDAAGGTTNLIFDTDKGRWEKDWDPASGYVYETEDAGSSRFYKGERLVGLTLHGETFTFAINNLDFRPGQGAGLQH